jgi:hypothetical protein
MRKPILTALASVWLAAFSQDHKANLDEATAAIVRELQSGQNQQVMVHTDKPHYKLGNTVYFRVYLFNAITHQPLKSARIHADLFDPSDSLVASILLNSASFEMDGGFKTSSKWKEGAYILKVYTEEMMASPHLSQPLEQALFLFGASGDALAYSPMPSLRPGIGFYPEGGNLINGLDNIVAFRAVDEKGLPLTLSGYLKDDAGKVVETFKTATPGFGKFSFMPSKNKSYQAVLTMPDKTERSFPLDVSTPGAWQISMVRSTADAMVFRVAQGDSLYPLKPASYVAAISNGKVVFASIGSGLFEVSIPKNSFAEGPADVLLFNEKKQIVSRRQVYIHQGSHQLTVTPDKTEFASRQLINVDLDLKDAKGQPMQGIFSVSVTDDRYVGAGVSFPRNAWMDLTDPVVVTPGKYEPLQDSVMWIKGVGKLDNGQIAGGYVANLMYTADNLLLTDTLGSGGEFRFRVPEFYEGKTFTVQATNAKGAISPVSLYTIPESKQWISSARQWVVDSSAKIAAYRRADADSFLVGSTMMLIKNSLDNPGKGKKQAQADVANRNSKMVTGEQLDKLGLGTTSQAVLMLPGVTTSGGRITIRGGTPSIGGGGSVEPLVITDGVPVTNTEVAIYLNSIPPQLIESIEVMTGGEAAQFGSRGFNGVILVKTVKQMRDLPFDPKTGFRYIMPQGYHKAPEFYMPRYDEPAVRSLNHTDNRSTIFWSGEVVTDKAGKARVKFYAADRPETYTIHVKGMSAKGDLLEKTITIGKK